MKINEARDKWRMKINFLWATRNSHPFPCTEFNSVHETGRRMLLAPKLAKFYNNFLVYKICLILELEAFLAPTFVHRIKFCDKG